MDILQTYNSFKELTSFKINNYLDEELGLYDEYIEPLNEELLQDSYDSEDVDRIKILFRIILWDKLFYDKCEFDEKKLLGEYSRRRFLSSLLPILDNPNKYAISYHTLNLICERWPQIREILSPKQLIRKEVETVEESLAGDKVGEEIIKTDSLVVDAENNLKQYESCPVRIEKHSIHHYSFGLKYKYNKAGLTAEVSGIEPSHDRILVIPPYIYHRQKKYIVIGIKNNVFENQEDIWSIILPETISYIGDFAFRHCTYLATAEIRENVKYIGHGAFEGCSCLKSITIPNSVTHIGRNAFCGCYNLVNVILPDHLSDIGESTFRECRSLSSINIPSSVKYIGHRSFEGCNSLKSITIPNSVTYIGCNAFMGCYNLANVTLSENIRDIEDYTFRECDSLSSISIPNSVTHIRKCAFFECRSLESVVMSNNIRSVGFEAFFGCDKMLKVVVPIYATLEYGAFPPTCVIVKKK